MADGRLPSVTTARESLVELADEWLAAIVALRRARSFPDPDRIRARVVELRSEFQWQAQAQGHKDADTADAEFALVALTDQTALTKDDAWHQRQLQLEFYKRADAGHRFFVMLDQIRRERQARVDVLEVYLACLQMGFSGEYGMGRRDALVRLIDEVSRDVALARDTPPPPPPPSHAPVRPAGILMSWWLPIAAFLALSLVAFGFASCMTHGQVQNVKRDVLEAPR